MRITWWIKLGGNLPLGHDVLLFPISGTGSFIYLWIGLLKWHAYPHQTRIPTTVSLNVHPHPERQPARQQQHPEWGVPSLHPPPLADVRPGCKQPVTFRCPWGISPPPPLTLSLGRKPAILPARWGPGGVWTHLLREYRDELLLLLRLCLGVYSMYQYVCSYLSKPRYISHDNTHEINTL